MHHSWGPFYPNDEGYHMPVPEYILESAKEQSRDNLAAFSARLRRIAQQAADLPDLRNDLIAILVESFVVPDAVLADAFDLDGQQGLMELREAEPVSLFSCLHPKCRTLLAVRDIPHLFRLRRISRLLCKTREGDLVKADLLSEMLCESCAQGLQHCHEQQLRAERLALHARRTELSRMRFEEYLKTPEWKTRRSRALIRAGNRCQVCTNTDRLEVHHRSYERFGDELLEDLVVMCRKCHQHFHDVPPKAA